MASVICLPGLLCTPELYEPVLSGVDASAQAIPMPDSDSFTDIATQIVATLPERAILVGLSMGSYLCLEIARQAPERIAGMVLIGCTARADHPKAASLRGKVVTWAQREGVEALAGSICATMLAEASKSNDVLRAKVTKMAKAQGLEVFARHQTALAGRPDATDSLPRIVCPVHVMTGAEDTITPPEIGQEMASALPNGRFSLIDGAGHLAVLERPEIVAAAINDMAAQVTQAEPVAQ